METAGVSGGGKKLVYVGGLAEDVEEKTLQAAFIPFGDIVEVRFCIFYIHLKVLLFHF
jgi:peptidyl-prolyl isomerase E (cyclophilin E)